MTLLSCFFPEACCRKRVFLSKNFHKNYKIANWHSPAFVKIIGIRTWSMPAAISFVGNLELCDGKLQQPILAGHYFLNQARRWLHAINYINRRPIYVAEHYIVVIHVVIIVVMLRACVPYWLFRVKLATCRQIQCPIALHATAAVHAAHNVDGLNRSAAAARMHGRRGGKLFRNCTITLRRTWQPGVQRPQPARRSWVDTRVRLPRIL